MQDIVRLWTSLNGRATRTDVWLRYALIAVVGSIVVLLLEALTGIYQILLTVWSLAMLWPGFAVGFKRYHDRGRSGRAFAVLYGLQAVLLIVLLVMSANAVQGDLPGRGQAAVSFAILVIWLYLLVTVGILKGQPGPNRYGPDPLNRAPEPVQTF
jgi:uncharacterized membrane protein YhaH (DUF805 family)